MNRPLRALTPVRSPDGDLLGRIGHDVISWAVSECWRAGWLGGPCSLGLPATAESATIRGTEKRRGQRPEEEQSRDPETEGCEAQTCCDNTVALNASTKEEEVAAETEAPRPTSVARETVHLVQAFLAERGQALRSEPPIACKSAEEACRRAQGCSSPRRLRSLASTR